MNRVKKIRDFFYSFFHLLFITTFLLVFMIVFICKDTNFNKILMIISTILFLLILFFIYKLCMKYKLKIDKLSYKHIALIFLLFIIFQVILGILLRVEPSWDFGFVYDEAVRLTKNHTWSITNKSYFLMYPNNQFYLLILTAIYKFFSLFHIAHYVIMGIISNIIFVDLSLIILYICMVKIWDKRIAFFGLMLSFLCCAYITYLPIFYTDTFPLPFTNIILLLYIVIIKEKNVKKCSFYFVLLTISCMFAFELKATAIIILVAIIFHMIFLMKWKRSFIFLIIIFATFIGSVKIYSTVFEKSNVLDMTLYDRYNYPYSHWIMMGLKTPGGYNEKDFHYTGSFHTKEEKAKANLEVIEKRLKNMNVMNLVNHLKYKINFTWNDGTYFSSELLSRKPLTQNFLRELISADGKYVDVFKFFTNGLHYAIIILMVFSGVNGLKLLNEKQKMDYISVVRLSVYGLFVFLLIWETKSKYLVNFLPLIYLVAIDGMNFIWCSLQKKNKIETSYM